MAQNRQDMGSGPVKPLLLQLMIPAVVAQVVNLLYNIVDRIYIGHIEGIGAAALTGVGLFAPILMLLNAFAMLIGAGGAPRTAIALGQGNKNEAEKIIGNSFTMLLFFAVVLTAGFYAGAPALLRLFGASDATLPYAVAYGRIYILGSVFVLLVMGMNPFITTQGFAKISMLTTVIGAVINIILDPILIFGIGIFPAMGIRGAAVATVAGYLLSMILAFALLLGKKQKVQVKIKDFHLKKQMIYRIFAFGLPSFIMNALSSFVVTFVNLFLVAYSDTAIAFFGAYFKVQQLIVMTVNGLIQGCLPVMRFNYGAGNSERLHSAFRYGTVLVTGMMILGTLAVLLFPAQILELFTASEAMRSFGISAMRIMAASYLFCGLSTMISTYFQTTEKVGSSMAIQLCRQMLFLVPALWCLDKLFQLNGIWLAFPVAETATLLVALVMMAWHRRKNIS